MTLSIHIKSSHLAEQSALLKPLLSPEIKVTIGDLNKSAGDFDTLVSGVPTREDILASPNLKALIIPWAGLPVSTRTLMQDFPNITVHNLHHNAEVVVEMAFSMMLTSLKKIGFYDRRLRAHDWRPRYEDDGPQLFSGRQALVLGFGQIGQRLTKLCSAIGLKTTALNRSGNQLDGSNIPIYPIEKLDTLLPQTDILFVALPLTEATDNLLDQQRLALLPDNATLINIGRGNTVNESALYNELKSRRISAALDVWYNYPKEKTERSNCPPGNFPFHELDNLIMTPHLAGHSDNIEQMRAEALALMLNTAAAGKPMQNLIDLSLGY